ncbi:hypothetical protein Slin15195_G078260 [Septoria linicola]|uniref:Uncharacterized protein n=1 Tax=Septoria linicola TaxID=215465 RepID=A0A9Q9AZ35_9PEZI|nr:hypothetical protein Slin14017_G039450 [Septoria linicola]USW54507.1 hypothetical protein Slin15195_G078260 [Septoria linicola]
MDIGEWLQNTADREPPEEQDHPSLPDLPQLHSRARRPASPDDQQKKKRACGDRHSKGAQRGHHLRGERNQRPAHFSSSDRIRHAAKEAVDSSSDSSSQQSDSSVSGQAREPVKAFERRARRKTRPDRYQAKTKKVREDRARKPRAKSKQRKNHRNADGARTTGLVQSFQLKNGPKNNRLTLRPEASIGIFNHGRASAPIAASGPGLPDLVFNEMKFLSKSKGARDHPGANEAPKQSKKSRKELREEEISAYFRNVTTERRAEQSRRHDHLPGADVQVRPAVETCQSTEHSAQLRNPVELPGKPFLGFGSRGVAHADTVGRSSYTWSESMAPEQQVPTKRSHSVHLEPPSPARPIARNFSRLSHNSSMSLPRQHTVAIQEPDRNIHAGQPRMVQRHGATYHEAVPYLESALGSTTSIGRQRRSTETPHAAVHYDDLGSDGYHTSDILVLREMHNIQNRSSSLRQRRSVSHHSAGKENQDPVTSTPASETLRDALNAVSRPPQMAYSSSRRESPGIMAAPIAQAWPEMTDIKHPTDPSQYVDKYGRPLLVELPRPQVPQRGFSRAGQNRMIESQQPPHRGSATTSNGQGLPTATQLASYPTRREEWVAVDTAFAGEGNETLWQGTQDGHLNISSRQAEEPVRRIADDTAPDLHHDGRSGTLHHTENNEMYFEQPPELLEDAMTWTEPCLMQMQDGGDFHEDEYDIRSCVDRANVPGTMAGFWRPNMLY